MHPSTPGKARFYHPELDCLRVGTFFMVFVAHSDYDGMSPYWAVHPILGNTAWAVQGSGFAGVSLFFALSSYLITALLLREVERTGTVHIKSFYVRRILRIWPLYFFFLFVVRPIAAHFIPWERFPGSYLAAFVLMVGNWQCVLHGWPTSVASPLWSISIEEQFYLGWPMLVSRMRRWVPAFAVGMLLVANGVRWWLVQRPISDPGMWANTLTRLDPFALGALLACWEFRRPVRIPGWCRGLIALAAALTLLWLGRFGSRNGPLGLTYYPMEAAACAGLLLATLRPAGSWEPGKLGRVFTYLGRISYGLYVFHILILHLMRPVHIEFFTGKLIALTLTIGVASISYVVLEKPFLGWKQKFTFVRSRDD